MVVALAWVVAITGRVVALAGEVVALTGEVVAAAAQGAWRQAPAVIAFEERIICVSRAGGRVEREVMG